MNWREIINFLGRVKHRIKMVFAQDQGVKYRYKLFAMHIPRGTIAIDCGANVGMITEYLGKSGATVYAFEPNPYAFEVLQKRFASRPNIHCIQKGVLDRNSTMKLYMHANSHEDPLYWSMASSLLEFKQNVSKDDYQEVAVIDLSEFIESLNARVRVLKMDVEGVECAILRKLINTGTIDKVDYIFVETHDQRIPELKQETDELRALIKTRNMKNIIIDWI